MVVFQFQRVPCIDQYVQLLHSCLATLYRLVLKNSNQQSFGSFLAVRKRHERLVVVHLCSEAYIVSCCSLVSSSAFAQTVAIILHYPLSENQFLFLKVFHPCPTSSVCCFTLLILASDICWWTSSHERIYCFTLTDLPPPILFLASFSPLLLLSLSGFSFYLSDMATPPLVLLR